MFSDEAIHLYDEWHSVYDAMNTFKEELKKFMEDLTKCITEPTLTIEKKNVDRETYRNFFNLLFNTNNENIFGIDDRDRSFIILSVSAIMKGNDEYFKKLDKCMYGNAQPFCHKTTGKLQVHTSRPTYIALTSFN